MTMFLDGQYDYLKKFHIKKPSLDHYLTKVLSYCISNAGTHYRCRVPMRYLSSWLDSGGPTAHKNDHLLLLPSGPDRKSTRLNSSHVSISYAVFCLKKKN